jgi:glutamate/tyrosine decarboxylase-like PLP-dependent enzyme
MPYKKKDSAVRRPLEAAFHSALSYLENLDESPAAATADLLTLRNQLSKPLTSEGVDPEQIIDELVQDVKGGLLGSAGGRFFGWVVGGSLSAALAADWLTATWDQNAALYACSPASAVVEEVVGRWLKEILGLPASASFALVTGCQMAHVTCLAAARHSLLSGRGWDVEQQGLFGAPPIRILSSSERHGSIERAVRLLGLGCAQVIDLKPDVGGCLQPETIEQALQSDPSALTILLLQLARTSVLMIHLKRSFQSPNAMARGSM